MTVPQINQFRGTHAPVVAPGTEEGWRCPGPAGTAREGLNDDVLQAAAEAEAVSTPMALARARSVETARRGKVTFEGAR